MEFAAEYRLWIKAAHIIAVIAWMAGLLYLPRLFVYHAEAALAGSEAVQVFRVMERKLLQVIMTPAMILSWVLGVWLAFTPGTILWSAEFWIHAKLALVLVLTAFHLFCARWRRELESGNGGHSPRFYRIANEVPAVIMAAIVMLAVVRPF